MKVCIFIMFYIFSSIFYVSAKEEKIDSIIAIVNDQVILNSDINQILFLLKQEGEDFKTPWKKNFLKEKVIQKLIVDSLILQEANKMNITVTKEQVNSVIENIALKKNISINDLKKNILFHNLNSHLSYNSYIKNIEKSLKIKIVQDYELHKRIHISEEEINLLLKKLIKDTKNSRRVNLSYILIPSSQENSSDIIRNKKILADNIADNLKKGYDLKNLYINYKQKKKIVLEKKMFWMRFLDIKKIFPKTLEIFKKGQILGPFLSNKGFYILKINDIDNSTENITTQFHIQHCLIKPSVLLTDIESKNYIFNIYDNIKKGVYNFKYAVEHLSHDFYSSKKNGDLGWISQDSFNLDFNKELFRLNKNEISKPIQSNFGWHIVKLLDTRSIDKFYNLKKKEAYNILLEKKIRLEKYNWIQDLKKISYIKIIRQ